MPSKQGPCAVEQLPEELGLGLGPQTALCNAIFDPKTCQRALCVTGTNSVSLSRHATWLERCDDGGSSLNSAYPNNGESNGKENET